MNMNKVLHHVVSGIDHLKQEKPEKEPAAKARGLMIAGYGSNLKT